jgi:hypothetical protein
MTTIQYAYGPVYERELNFNVRLTYDSESLIGSI